MTVPTSQALPRPLGVREAALAAAPGAASIAPPAAGAGPIAPPATATPEAADARMYGNCGVFGEDGV